jgi:transcriptional regulator GlxA family with amidase domain
MRSALASSPDLGNAPSPRPRAKLRVGFILMHNFTLTAFSSFVDVLRLAADEGDKSRPIHCSWQIMSPHCKAARSSCGVLIQPTSSLLEPSDFDYIVVVGGLLHGAPPIDQVAAGYLRRAAAARVKLIGVCTGSFVLCRLGLMDGRKCCVSWYHYRDFVEEFPQLVPVADRLFVSDRDRITCSGGVGVADLAAKLVGEHLGLAQAQKALHILLVDRARSDASAQPAPPLAVESDDDRVSRALLLMEQHLADPLSVVEIAAQLKISARQLERLFHERLSESPQESYMAIRLKHAKWMLENTDLSSAAIAAELGFVDGSHLSRSFRGRFGTTPIAFRLQVRAKPRATPKLRRAGVRAEENEDRRVFD